ncbi:hypothetical protein [Micromonospora sp. NBC_01796]|uniref:hypothetical protein n=1 Tax=Micromonospora sp. NBC_01796 TaxID=2975987 RepID=UPI002DDBDE56|nr:hypothetical protein [Micromonospora sp. NBC_01796]WSA89538.1 hypothetical protein OIE47_19080 [Micromonospora sp. NBC_01796]
MAERKKLLLRLDPQVYDALARWAGDDLRSVNAQIEFALRLALRTVGRSPKPSNEPASGESGPASDESGSDERAPGESGG